MKDYDYDLRDEALRDLLKNIKSNEAKEKSYEMKYKSKKLENKKNESISVLSKKWNNKRGFYSTVFTSTLKCNKKLPKNLLYSSRLIKTPTKKYILAIPKPLEIRSENQAPEKSMLFIDPGVKNFITGYDPSGKVISCGIQDIQRISKLLYYKRKLQSKHSKLKNHKKRRSYKLAELRIGEKIFNLVDDLHKKLSKWLCENYEYIYIPRLNYHKCKKLNKRSKANMASLRHCGFINRLLFKSREYPKCHVYEVNEAFTSKTCSSCGYQKNDLYNNNVYNCNRCHLVISRDINASKNIMLRYFNKRAIVC